MIPWRETSWKTGPNKDSNGACDGPARGAEVNRGIQSRTLHSLRDGVGAIQCKTPASGLTTAIDPILRASARCLGCPRKRQCGPGGGRCSRSRRLFHPKPLRTLFAAFGCLSESRTEYYYGLANEGLWPLCHAAFHRPRFSRKNWASYREANQIFADAVLEEADGNPALVFIQDYHLALLPGMLKRNNPNLTIAQFWHIPWPNRETFRAFPWKDELLDGMLGNDLLGFHLQYHCANFLETVERAIEARVDAEHGYVSKSGHVTDRSSVSD